MGTQNLVKLKKENLVKASKQIWCSQEKVSVLIWNSENICVHRQWIQSYFRFHEIFVFTRDSSTVYNAPAPANAPESAPKHFIIHI